MKQIVPGACHIIVASRHQDGAVGLFYTTEPGDWLVAISNQFPLDQVEVRPGKAAAKVVELLRRRFADQHVPNSGMPWYLLDHSQALKALDEYSLETGRIVSRLDVRLDDTVQVADMGRGVVTGFTQCGRVMVRLARESPHSVVAVIAPRSQIKPVLRSVPL